MKTLQSETLETAQGLRNLQACLAPVSKNGRGDLTLLESDTFVCEEDECKALIAEHALRLELKSHDPCDSKLGQLLEATSSCANS
ncbi:MAG: hypothetical protein AAF567_23650 [Actinomycetota bacterium]